MRVLVCGGRAYADRQALYDVLDKLHSLHKIETVIAGGAKGADSLAEGWARERGVP